MGAPRVASREEMRAYIDARVIPEPNSGCLLWTGAVNDSGYGIVGWNYRTQRVHRLVYEIANGPIPKEKPFLRHSCDVPSCCNLAHLTPGTNLDNMRDMRKRNRQSRHPRAKGEKNGNVRLTENIVREMRSLALTDREMGMRFGVSEATARQVRTRTTWKHV